MAPQPRVAPTVAPPAPVAAPQMPVAIPNAPGPVSGDAGKLTRKAGKEPQTDYLKTPDASSDAQPGPTGGPQKTIRVINNSETDTARGVSGAPTGPAEPKPNYQNNPIPGIDVVVQKKPPYGKLPQSTTDANGQATFRELPPGNYDVVLPKVAGGSTVSMTMFVNGKVQARTVFPPGSSVGTFAVANARDTVTLKFESNSQPVNGIGGQGGGRYTFKPTNK